MKTILKHSILIICLCLIPFSGNAQQQNELKKAIGIVKKSNNVKDYEKALEDILQYADEGNSEAMHALGVIYWQGRITDIDYKLSKYWFEKASEAGYIKSDYNLAMIYRLGRGVDQNFGTALQYLKKCAKTNAPQALYGVGYFYYKGLGCKQNYVEAIKYFTAAAEQNHPYATFMLGLCYRNGYGVSQDLSVAEEWLNKAKSLGNEAAYSELGTDTPERPLQSIKLRSMSLSQNDLPIEEHQIVNHSINKDESIEGVYEGMLITYDWSGKYILKESPIEVTLEFNGNEYLVKWFEEDATEVEAIATLTDSSLKFSKATYFKKDHFRRINPREWNFVEATLKSSQSANSMSFSGNLQLYSPDNKEPGKPMYLTLQPKNVNAIEETVAIGDIISVYPNPVTDYLNVSFSLDKEVACQIDVFSLSGSLIYRQNLGKLTSGAYRYQINMDVPAGSYIVKVYCGDKVHNSTIVKEN